MNDRFYKPALPAAFAFLLLISGAASADSGMFFGANVGTATVEAQFGDTGIPGFPSSIDEDDTGFKIFAGYKFDLPLIDLAVEGGYVDLGEPTFAILDEQVSIDTTGFNLWGVASFDAGPLDIYGKLGYIAWDIEASAVGESFSDDGSDPAYGLGVGFGFGALTIRGEYEVYDIDEVDVSMLSVGLVFQFD